MGLSWFELKDIHMSDFVWNFPNVYPVIWHDQLSYEIYGMMQNIFILITFSFKIIFPKSQPFGVFIVKYAICYILVNIECCM